MKRKGARRRQHTNVGPRHHHDCMGNDMEGTIDHAGITYVGLTEGSFPILIFGNTHAIARKITRILDS